MFSGFYFHCVCALGVQCMWACRPKCTCLKRPEASDSPGAAEVKFY